MIEFATVSREFRGLVARRRDLMTLLGSIFAAMGIFLQNALQGGLPPALGSIGRHVFAFYAAMLLGPSLLLALRMARLHGGMVLNGILYAHLLRDQDFAPPGDPGRAGRHNWVGVSFLQFLLTDLIAGFSAGLLGVALAWPPWAAAATGGAVAASWLGIYGYFHRRGREFALRKIAESRAAPVAREAWREHVQGTLEDCNLGMIADVGFVGLIVFSVFETLSGLNRIDPDAGPDLVSRDVRRLGPILFVGFMGLTCLIGMATYLRVRVAIGRFSLQLDPTDRPFRPGVLTDSLLGFMILGFLLAVSVHLMSSLAVPALGDRPAILLGIDLGVFATAIVVEQLTLIVAGRRPG